MIVVAVLLLALLFGGVLKLGGAGSGGGGGSSGPTALTYRQALAVANQSVVNSRGGSWSVVLASMLDVPYPVNENLWNPCGPEGFSPNSTALGPQGEAYNWFFIFASLPFSASFSHELFVSVWNDSGTLVTQMDPGSMCRNYPTSQPLPGNLSDSSQAVAAASSDGGSLFLSTHPGSLVLAETLEQYSSVSFSIIPIWFVYFETVTPSSGTTAPYSLLYLTLQGTNLHLISRNWYNGSVTGGAGSTAPPYPVQFAASTSGSAGAGTLYFDNVTMTVPASLGMTSTNLSLAILEPNQTYVNPGNLGLCIPPLSLVCGAPAGGGWIVVLSSGATPVDSYPSSPTNLYWNGVAGTVGITGTMTLEFISTFPLAGSGDTLRAFNTQAHTTGSLVL